MSIKWVKDYSSYSVKPTTELMNTSHNLAYNTLKQRILEYDDQKDNSKKRASMNILSDRNLESLHDVILYVLEVSEKITESEGKNWYKIFVINQKGKVVSKLKKTFDQFLQFANEMKQESANRHITNQLPDLRPSIPSLNFNENSDFKLHRIRSRELEHKQMDEKTKQKKIKNFLETLSIETSYYQESFYRFFEIKKIDPPIVKNPNKSRKQVKQPEEEEAFLFNSDLNLRDPGRTKSLPKNYITNKARFNFNEKIRSNTDISELNSFSHDQQDLLKTDRNFRAKKMEMGSSEIISSGSESDYEKPIVWDDFLAEDTVDYCFNLEINFRTKKKINNGGNYYHSYLFVISEIMPCLSNKQNWEINKRYSEFKNLLKQLGKNHKRNIYPELSEKQYINILKEDLSLRGPNLEKFLLNVTNEKYYLNMEILEFLDLSKQECNKILAKMNDTQIFSKFRYKINLNGYVKLTSDNHYNDPFVCYKIDVKVIDPIMNRNVIDNQIKRRYKDFLTLDNELRAKFRSSDTSMPKFPSRKWVKDLHIYREKEFDRYLNELIEMPNIFDFIIVLKFLNIKPKLLYNNKLSDSSNNIRIIENNDHKNSHPEETDLLN